MGVLEERKMIYTKGTNGILYTSGLFGYKIYN
jgi:hypothetical protein